MTATTQQVHIAHDDVGTGDPPVVLLHGLFEDRSYYAAQVQHLATSHRVLSIDLRGHGESDVPDDGYSIDVLADDVIRVCEETGVTNAVFCGHSFALALRVAVRRPNLAAGVVLLDGVVLMPPRERERLAGFAHVLETDSWREALLGFFGGVAGGAVERVRADIATVPRVYAAPLIHEIASSDNATELEAARCPLLYVHSGMPLDLERLRVLRPDAVIETIPNVGHYVMLTAPDEVNAALDRFLASLAKGGSGVSSTSRGHSDSDGIPSRNGVAQAFVREPHEAKALMSGKNLVRASATQTGGAFELFEIQGPAAPPPHVHRGREELFYVLSGQIEFLIGDEVKQTQPGSLVFVPRGTRHGFKAGPDGRTLVLVAPAGLEGFFEELGAGLARGKTSHEMRQQLESRYDATEVP